MGLSESDKAPAVALNVTIPMANGAEVRCNNSLVTFELKSLETSRFASEYLFGLGATGREDQEAKDLCNSLLVMGWSRGSVIVEERNDGSHNYTMDASTYENTTILCTQQISSAEFNVVVDNKGLVQEFKRLTPLNYDNSSHFDHSTTIASFKAQLSTLIRTGWDRGIDIGAMHNSEHPSSLPQYFKDSQTHLKLYTTRRPPFEDAQRGFQGLYSWFTAIAIGQNSDRIFRSTTKDGGRNQTRGRRTSVQDRVSMDPVMFYIAMSILSFSTLASVVIFYSCPEKFLPRIPNTIAAEIGFFYASQALQDAAGTAHMSSAMREMHPAMLRNEYGYGEFTRSDGKSHTGIERMERIGSLIQRRHRRSTVILFFFFFSFLQSSVSEWRTTPRQFTTID